MTYAEILEEIDAYNRRRKSEYEDQRTVRAEMDYRFAQLINLAVLDGKNFPKTLNEAYPDIFKDTSVRIDWRENKQGWAAYAAEFNRQRGR